MGSTDESRVVSAMQWQAVYVDFSKRSLPKIHTVIFTLNLPS